MAKGFGLRVYVWPGFLKEKSRFPARRACGASRQWRVASRQVKAQAEAPIMSRRGDARRKAEKEGAREGKKKDRDQAEREREAERDRERKSP